MRDYDSTIGGDETPETALMRRVEWSAEQRVDLCFPRLGYNRVSCHFQSSNFVLISCPNQQDIDFLEEQQNSTVKFATETSVHRSESEEPALITLSKAAKVAAS
ncbi:hypothetical protein V6N12_068232 [Hibiscus sabdariffa]|uniref:Uncharacterized protein n=1 Tax=Hibiscus sabdariffa TaxID=183260 RepID=A0ABR2FPF9_9ROSI